MFSPQNTPFYKKIQNEPHFYSLTPNISPPKSREFHGISNTKLERCLKIISPALIIQHFPRTSRFGAATRLASSITNGFSKLFQNMSSTTKTRLVIGGLVLDQARLYNTSKGNQKFIETHLIQTEQQLLKKENQKIQIEIRDNPEEHLVSAGYHCSRSPIKLKINEKKTFIFRTSKRNYQ